MGVFPCLPIGETMPCDGAAVQEHPMTNEAGPAGRDILVIGASAGGVEALQALVAQFPADLAAAVFVVLHLAPDSISVLPRILDRAGPLPARAAEDGAVIRPGRIYVA